jgi:hypothetical protein
MCTRGQEASNHLRLVGAARFELAASRSQTERSTKLSHAPDTFVSYKKLLTRGEFYKRKT